ncbi:MAG: HlyD family efflux transporter periplasmic adaptor subunit [Alphaproteobacteria bacterium]|nr:HlyD family efflux transporter periplasmic adaptor subunit [Alphaproteobacteria bacterium]
MLKVNLSFALFLVLGVTGWVIFADLGGYTSRNAMIIARSTSVVSTIDGKIVDVAATVGAKVTRGSPLVTVENDRIDRSRLTELLSQQAFLDSEIMTSEARGAELSAKIERFDIKASAYLAWMSKDLQILRTKTLHELKAAEELRAVKTAEALQMAELLQSSQISASLLAQAESEAIIQQNEVLALEAELARVDLRVASVKSAGVLQENGNASYWEEVRDRMAMQLLENRRQIATMTASLAQLEEQISVERRRVGTTSAEQHTAKVDGIINAVLTSKGERVIAGANLVEVLDCAHPIAIVSVPDHRFGDFYIGQKATIRPLDSDERILGAVQHISSSALISRDTSIAASPDIQIGGNKVIVAFQNQERGPAATTLCDTARRAVVTIETDTLVSDVGRWLAARFDDVAWAGVPAWIAGLGAER